MKRWAATVVALYVALLVALTAPLAFLCSRPDPLDLRRNWLGENYWSFWVVVWRFWQRNFSFWPYWLVIGLLGVAQALYLVVPSKLRANTPLAQRHILTHVFAAGLVMALLLEALLLALISTLDDIYTLFGLPWPSWLGWAWLGLLPWFWVWWSFVFWRYTTLMEPTAWTKRIATGLFTAGIFECLVAVICRIIAGRSGGYWYWGAGTFFPIATGVAVALFAFGPRVFFLFVDREEKMMSRKQRQEAGLD